MRRSQGLTGRRRIGWVLIISGRALVSSTIAAARGDNSGLAPRRVRRLVIAAALTTLLVVPINPAAARAKPSAPDRVYAGETSQAEPAFVQIGGTGTRTATVVVAWRADCDDGTGALLWDGAKLTIRKNHFAFQRSEDASGPQITLSGAVGKTAVKGTWHAKVTFRNDQGNPTATCDTGLVRFSLPRAGYGGLTRGGDGYPLVLAFNKRKTKVDGVDVIASLHCESGDSFAFHAAYGDFGLSRAGAFGDEFDDSADEIKADPHPTFHISFHGKLGRSSAQGTLRITAVMKDAQGNQVDSCDSGPLTWSAGM